MLINKGKPRRRELTRASRSQAPEKSWAERHAPLATIIAAYSTLAAVIVAGIGYYFTVIPLYQKAVVDELIAKREIELKEAQADISKARREAYEQHRANFARSIELQAADCSDIRNSIRTPSPDLDDKSAIRADHERRIKLDVNVTQCLASVLAGRSAEKTLSTVDLNHVKYVFEQTGAELDKQRLEAIKRIGAMPVEAGVDPSVLEPVGPAMQRYDKVIAEWENQLHASGIRLAERVERSEKRFQYRIEITQEKIARDYRGNASDSIRAAIRAIKWPDNEGR